jgi:hypothetical protein
LKFNTQVLINPIIYLIIGLFFLSCSNESEIPKDEIIAKVGDRIITKDEFVSSYEFSFAPFRTGANPRKDYLDYMIKELMIANEGYTQGFNKSKYVQDRVNIRKNNNLLEAFYLKHVHSKVNIPEDKIIDVLKKSTIKFRMVIWPTPSLERAAIAYDAASETSLEDYISKEIDKLEVKNVEKKNFETDWMDFLEMKPEIFASIANLEMGKPSKPVPYEGGYAIFEIIDINREAIKSDELVAGPRRKKIEARLHNIESDRIVHEIMDSILTPLNVKVSSKVIDLLTLPLYSWVKAGIPERGSIVDNLNAVTDTSRSYLIELKKLLPEKIFSSKEGVTTVEDYFNYMNYHRTVINNSENPIDLKNRLLTEVGTMIKNKKFIEIANGEGYLDSANIKNDLLWWEEKWTYDIFRDNIIKDITVTDEEMQKYFKERWRELRIANVDTTRFYKYEADVYNAIIFEKHSKLLKEKLEEFKKRYPVWINEELLSKVELNEAPKSKETSVFVIKNFSGELLVPTADPQWLSY